MSKADRARARIARAREVRAARHDAEAFHDLYRNANERAHSYAVSSGAWEGAFALLAMRSTQRLPRRKRAQWEKDVKAIRERTERSIVMGGGLMLDARD